MRVFARFGVVPSKRFLLVGEALFFAGSLLGIPLHAQSPASSLAGGGEIARIRRVSVTPNGEAVDVEIQASAGIFPESQSINSPDRIIVDFPGALPAAELRPVKVNNGALKAIRTGLFSKNPPITRVVLDLAEPQAYQVRVHENAVTLKLLPLPAAGQALAMAVKPAPPPPAVTVTFQHGMLRIHAKGATLAEVLFEVQKHTGAEIPIPAGAEQEMVAADIGPAPAREALAALLNGSRYNFIFIDDDQGHSLQKAILSLR
jgi:hypothetical protein